MSRLSQELLGQILDEHGPALVLYARQWCNTPDDVVQEAFFSLLRQPETVANAMRGRFEEDNATTRFGGLNLTAQQLRGTDRIIMTACGRERPVCVKSSRALSNMALSLPSGSTMGRSFFKS